MFQQRKFAQLENVKHEMDDFVKELKIELSRAIKINRWTEKEAKHHFKFTVYSLKKYIYNLVIPNQNRFFSRLEENMIS